MKITKQNDNYLFQNEKGEYHLSIEKYNELGEEKATQFVQEEISKKLKANFSDQEIDFKKARKLGFCEYGIKDFCKKLNLDKDLSYKIKDLEDKLTENIFLKYPNEIIKIFTKDIINKFGGVKEFLSKNRTSQSLNLIINNGYLSDKDLYKLSTKFALMCINNYEKTYPNDDRPRKAIEAKLLWIDGKITDEGLQAASSAAESAAWSAVRSAESAAWSARSAESAARSTAWSASSAAESAWSAWSAARSAESAAWSAARSAWSAAWSARSAESAAESARSAARSAESAESAESAAWSARSAESASSAWSAAIEEQIKLVLETLEVSR